MQNLLSKPLRFVSKWHPNLKNKPVRLKLHGLGQILHHQDNHHPRSISTLIIVHIASCTYSSVNIPLQQHDYKHTHRILSSYGCATENVIYLLQCNHCDVEYIYLTINPGKGWYKISYNWCYSTIVTCDVDSASLKQNFRIKMLGTSSPLHHKIQVAFSRMAPRFSRVGIIPYNASGLRFFSGISCFLCHCILALLHTHYASPLLTLLRASKSLLFSSQFYHQRSSRLGRPDCPYLSATSMMLHHITDTPTGKREYTVDLLGNSGAVDDDEPGTGPRLLTGVARSSTHWVGTRQAQGSR
ncbi:hypothetical protein PR048_017509 [Dryococelus australis]|uniref:Uncharacterized protein n=1 Tax=Dryococelus australis TaxID=614101 RepID=A0ABQ9H9W5_9NEOP|nr:hypothetical protein PR048_017509 [Dryococelus australis]